MGWKHSYFPTINIDGTFGCNIKILWFHLFSTSESVFFMQVARIVYCKILFRSENGVHSSWEYFIRRAVHALNRVVYLQNMCIVRRCTKQICSGTQWNEMLAYNTQVELFYALNQFKCSKNSTLYCDATTIIL